MKVVLASACALALTATLAGCGDASRPVVEPATAGKPTWGGCQEHTMQITDYVADARGARTRTAALASYRIDGDHVVDRPARPHRNAQVLLVGDDDVIHDVLELMHTRNGWLVSSVESCSH
jgi:hypothetical protein